MNKEEKDLFKKLCSFKVPQIKKSNLTAATPAVLGQLFFNRMQAVAYGNLKDSELLSCVNREFRNSLKGAYEYNVEKNESFFYCVNYLQDVLSECKCKYAMLKGAYLCKLYPDGYRTSNDIDLLVSPNSVSEIGHALEIANFRQGSIKNGKFEPASRKEIIESRLTRGETVPYIKEINLPRMKYLEVDINFSLDYKPSDTKVLEQMLDNTTIKNIKGLMVQTLSEDDFFIHLCSHLYKEATALPWVEMKRDMTLYKYCDIYILIDGMSKIEVDLLFRKAKMMDTEYICAFCIVQTSKLFNLENEYAVSVAENILKKEPDFIHTVVSPKDRKKYIFSEKDIFKRFFANDRKTLLEEVKE